MANITADMIKDLRERTGVGMMDCKRALQEVDGDMDKAIRLLKERGATASAKKAERNAKEGIVGFCINNERNKASFIELQCETDFVAKNEQFQELALKIATIGMNSADNSVENLLNAKAENGDSVTDMINQIVQKCGEKTILSRFEKPATDGFFGYYLHFTKKLVTLVEFNCKPKTDKAKELADQIAMHAASERPLAIDRAGLDEAAVKEQRDIFEKITLDSGKTGDMVAKIVDGKMNSWYAESVLIDQKLFTDNKITIKSLIEEIGKECGEEKCTIKNMLTISIGK